MDDQPPPYPVIAEIVRETTPTGPLSNVAENQVSFLCDVFQIFLTSLKEQE